MSKEILNGSDKLNVAYVKINSNFDELYAGAGGGGGGAINLNDLSDVDLNISPLTTYQVLQWDGSVWVNSKVTMDELNDVTFTNLQHNDILRYNIGDGWINQPLSYVSPQGLSKETSQNKIQSLLGVI